MKLAMRFFGVIACLVLLYVLSIGPAYRIADSGRHGKLIHTACLRIRWLVAKSPIIGKMADQ
jgi:hypothetical protein